MTPEDRSSVADGPLDGTDTLVLGAVRELFSRTDPMPSGLTDRIKFELTLAALHAEVAELQELTLTGVRADSASFTPTESVTFTSSTLSLMVSINPAGEGARPGTVRIDGWVTGGPRRSNCAPAKSRSGPKPMPMAGSRSTRFHAGRCGSSCDPLMPGDGRSSPLSSRSK